MSKKGNNDNSSKTVSNKQKLSKTYMRGESEIEEYT